MTTTLDLTPLADAFSGKPQRKADRRRARHALAFRKMQALMKRQMEGLALYRPLPIAEAFHRSDARIRLLDGANQSGKTLAAEVEVARALLGVDPYDKYPKHNGRALAVAHEGDHISQVTWKTLTQPGAFSIIRDEHTQRWRSVRFQPDDPTKLDPYDDAYREKWREAPPLLPKRLMRVAWDDFGRGIPRVLTIPSTGWKMLWRSSKGDAVRGVQLNLWHFDEEIGNQDFLPECLRACMRYSGRGFWSATPQTGGVQLYDLHDQAEHGSEGVEAYTLSLIDNPFYPDEEKQAFYNQLTEDEREVRYYGRYPRAGLRVYPMFAVMGIHGYEFNEVPDDHCRIAVVDPGTQFSATVFASIDRDDGHVWVYDELDLRNADAGRWADEMYRRQGEHAWDLIVCDQNAGRQHSMGRANTVAEHYWEALCRRGIKPRVMGSERGMGGFFPGSNDVEGRQEALLDWMAVRGEGTFAGSPRLKVARGRVPVLERQVKAAQMEMPQSGKSGKRRKQQRRLNLQEDVLVCLEYLAAYNPFYREPVKIHTKESNPAYDKYLEFKDRRKRRHEQHAFAPTY